MSNVRKKNTKYLRAFGDNLRRIRTEQGLTQEDLAYEIGVSFTSVNRIESGKINTTVATIKEIAKALDVHPKDLFDF